MKVRGEEKEVTERNLASIQTISEIRPIPGADAIEVARVKGWDVVVKKGEFELGDHVVYFEIDSALPVDREEFSFLKPRGVKVIDGREYHVLRTVKLRGQVSQGLVIPLDVMSAIPGGDMSAYYEVIKYEPPIPANLQGGIVGPFTRWIQKTDAERVQNLAGIFDTLQNYEWYATEKIDGTSVTIWNDDGHLRLFSRNWELKWDENLPQVKVAHKLDLIPDRDFAWQGEFFGNGVQGNPLGISGNSIAVFSMWDMRDGVRLDRDTWSYQQGLHGAPVLRHLEFPSTIEEAVHQADGLVTQLKGQRQAEGIVWHTRDGKTPPGLDRPCFKVINNKYLLKKED